MSIELQLESGDHTVSASHFSGRASALAAVVAGLTAGAILRGGAFHDADAFAVGFVSLLIVALVVRFKVEPPAKFVVMTLTAASAWWLLLAVADGTYTDFLPLGTSMVAFLASFLVAHDLGPPGRQASAKVFVALGTVTSLMGLVAVAIHWSPLAVRSGSSWRLASTLSYQNAAGLLLAMVLLVALSLDQARSAARLALCVCAAGLVATQSRGAVLALLAGVMFVPMAQFRRALLPLLAGLVAGVLVVLLSAESRLHLLAVLPVICTALLSVAARRHDTVTARMTDLAHVVTVLVTLGLGVGVAWFLVHPARAHLLEFPGGDARAAIWRSALDQWRSSPILGVGPDHGLQLHSSAWPAGTVAMFVHNEYLQVLADGGLLAAGLLAAVGGAVVRSLRRDSLMSSCAIGAFVAFAVGGAFDFAWHLPALALTGGWVAGLASRRTP